MLKGVPACEGGGQCWRDGSFSLFFKVYIHSDDSTGEIGLISMLFTVIQAPSGDGLNSSNKTQECPSCGLCGPIQVSTYLNWFPSSVSA